MLELLDKGKSSHVEEKVLLSTKTSQNFQLKAARTIFIKSLIAETIEDDLNRHVVIYINTS